MDAAGDAMERGDRAPLLPVVTARTSLSLHSTLLFPRFGVQCMLFLVSDRGLGSNSVSRQGKTHTSFLTHYILLAFSLLFLLFPLVISITYAQ
jgi:hypothetical protein